MRRLGKMVLILLGAVMLLGSSDALAKGPRGDMWGTARFDAMDTNKDGQVSKDEFLAAPHQRSDPEAMFQAMDVNGQGYLTKDEFCSGKGMGMGKGMRQGMGQGMGSTAISEIAEETY